MWERGTQDWYALFGKSIRREAFSQGKIRNMQEYWMPLYYTRFAAFVKRAIFSASASVS